MRWIVGAAVALAALTLLGPSQPGYDPWAWLLWGREIAHGTLSTAEGPAFKPLPVAVCALLSFLGDDAAPQAWLVVARAGAIAAVAFAALLAVRLTEWGLEPAQRAQSPTHVRIAAAVAAAGVLLAAGWWWHAAVGNAEGLFLALVLAAVLRALDDRHGHALTLGVLAGLIRPELWPFLGAYGLWLFANRPTLRPWLVATATALPALWFVPELIGSGDVLRSGDRAQIPNPGQPATADRPFLASLDLAAGIPLLPVALLCLAALGHARTRLLAAAGLAWCVLIALMAEAGFSGEARYALPGAALLAVPAAATLQRAPRAVAAATLVLLLVAAVPRINEVEGELQRAAADARLWASLPTAIEHAGGRDTLLACGPPVTGRYRGSGVAYALDVRKDRVLFDATKAGVLLRSRIRPHHTVQPPAPETAATLGRSARWHLAAPYGCPHQAADPDPLASRR